MSDALTRLRDPDAPHLRALAVLMTDSLLDTPLVELLPPDVAARQLRRALQAAVDDPVLRARFVSTSHDLRARLLSPPWAERSPREWVVPEVEAPLRELIATPWTPDEALVLRLINHPSLRDMLQSILSASLHGFVDRIRHMDDGILGGLGGRAVQRGKSLFGGLTAGLTSATEGLVGTIKAELQSALESRIQPFVGQASEDAVARIAAWIADPAQATALAEMRLAAVDALLDTPLAELTRQADVLDPERLADLLLAAARGLLDAPGLDAHLQPPLRDALIRLGTLRDALRDHGLASALDTVRPELTDAVAQRLAGLVHTDAFATWWSELHR